MTSAIISAFVALFVAVLNHFNVTPIKERHNRKRGQLKNLYAPLYTLICIRLQINELDSLESDKLSLNSLSTKEFTKEEFMEKFLFEKSGYCSNSLMEA